jgi:predicted HTH domain antitoxin
MPNWTNATTSRINALARLREVVPLERQRQQLTSTIVSLRTAVQIRDGRIERLELLVRERNETVDRLKYANERLGLENHLLMAMLVAPTPVEAEMLPAK